MLAVEPLQVASIMGMFQIRVKVSNPTERSRFFEEDFWVDTGALYSYVPEGRLKFTVRRSWAPQVPERT
jgi:hypothetical protein